MAVILQSNASSFFPKQKWKEDGVWCEAEEGKEAMAFFLIRK